MKKLIALLLAALLVCSLAACQTAPAGDQTNATGEQTEPGAKTYVIGI